MSLDECLELASRNHPELRVRELEGEIALEDRKTAKGGYYPTVDFRAAYMRVNERASLPIFGGANLFTTIGSINSSLIGATAVQPIFDGRIVGLNRLAAKRQMAADLQTELSRRQVSSVVKKSFFKTLFLRELTALQREFHRSASARLAEVREKYRKGEASALDLARAEAAVAVTQAGIQEAQSNLESSKDELKRLIGYPLERTISLEGSLDEFLSGKRSPVSSEGAGVEEMKTALAEANYESAVAARKQKRSEFYPRLYGYFDLYFTFPDLLLEPDEKFQLHYRTGAFLELPLFDGFRRQHEYHRARHMERIAEIGREEAERNREMKERKGERPWMTPQVRLQAPRKSLEQMNKALEVAKVAYRNDLISFAELLQVEKGWAEAKVGLAKAKLEWLVEWSDRE